MSNYIFRPEWVPSAYKGDAESNQAGTAPMIIAENLSKFFKNTGAVKDISFAVNEGETLVLLGTSGCGKTTTLRMINRLIEPSSGNIYINGKSIFSQPVDSLRRGIGYVLQNNGLFPHYTIAENIAVVPRLLGWDNTRIEHRTRELLETLRLSPEKYLNAYPQQLSGGQQQRAGLARALAANPPILLMDEPFGALDPVTRIHIRREFGALEELKKKTIILVTHDVQEAFELGDRICLMDQGTIVQNGTPLELLLRPANDFVESFLSNQRLQLELNAIKLKDVWNNLENDGPGRSVEPADIHWEQSLWDAMESWYGPGPSAEIITVGNDREERKQISASSLLEAFNQFKRSY